MSTAFTVTSTDFTEGVELPRVLWSAGAGGEDRSPQLAWAGAPEGARSYAVTCFDPDAPGGSGWWHWGLVDVPDDVTSLPADAGAEGGVNLPHGAFALRNQSGAVGYSGPRPPAGTGTHRYVFTVVALDVASLGLAADAGFDELESALQRHEVARATIAGTAAAG